MQPQNYSNHRRFVPGFHYVTSTIALVILVLAIINLVVVKGSDNWLYTGMLPFLISVVLVLLFLYSRTFAVTVQNRAIRAEENFRHYLLTNKLLDQRLTMGQIVALRFAGDDEYLALVHRALSDNMRPDDIKKAIKNWRADNHRC
ncbi:MAG: DUF6526 family protein [Bacteroidota bacterium]